MINSSLKMVLDMFIIRGKGECDCAAVGDRWIVQGYGEKYFYT